MYLSLYSNCITGTVNLNIISGAFNTDKEIAMYVKYPDDKDLWQTPQVKPVDGVHTFNKASDVTVVDCTPINIQLFEDGTFGNEYADYFITEEDLNMGVNGPVQMTFEYPGFGPLTVELEMTECQNGQLEITVKDANLSADDFFLNRPETAFSGT
eukprot:Awhi_evm2s4625